MVAESLSPYVLGAVVGGSLVAIYFMYKDLREIDDELDQMELTLAALVQFRAAAQVIERYNLAEEYRRELDDELDDQPDIPEEIIERMEGKP